MKKNVFKICTILFILASLLPINGNMTINEVAAQDELPLNFETHYRYNQRTPELGTRSSWELDVDFRGRQIHARWIFRVEQTEDGEKWFITDEFIIIPDCKKHGKVRIKNGVARFDPNTKDYITCETPSYSGVVEEMMPFLFPEDEDEGENQITDEGESPNEVQMVDDGQSEGEGHHEGHDRCQFRNSDGCSDNDNEDEGDNDPPNSFNVCDTCIDPWISGEIRINPNAIQDTYPIAYLQSDDDMNTVFQTEAVFNQENSQVHNLSSYLTEWDVPQTSGMISQNGWYNFWVGMNVNRFLDIQEVQHDSNYQTAWMEQLVENVESLGIENDHWFSWAEGVHHPSNFPSTPEFVMSTGPQTFYIGHNPETGEYFRGNMRSIGVDPGCVGN